MAADGNRRMVIAFPDEPWKARLMAAVAVKGGGATCEGAFAAGRDRGVGAISSETSQPSGNSRTWGLISSNPFPPLRSSP